MKKNVKNKMQKAFETTGLGFGVPSAKPESSDIERSTIQSYTNFGLKARAI